MGVKFTDEQNKAITTTDVSVLVSAAAGSGKTAVLVERILRIILEGKADVDEMLVVTFTKAAAADMRLKLSKAIRKRMHEHPEEAKRLKDQLGKLYKAYISTIDSFALRVIREFFYQTDTEPDFAACDEVQGELMKREAVAELFEAGFEDDHFLDDEIGFRDFLRLYSSDRSEDGIKDDILRAYSSLRSMPDYFNWAYSRAEDLLVTEDGFEKSRLHEVIYEDTLGTMQNAYAAARKTRDFMFTSGFEDLFEKKLAGEFNTIADAYTRLRAGSMDRDLMESIAAISYPRLVPGKELKESFDLVKDEVKNYRNMYKKLIADWMSKYMNPDFDTRLKEMNEAYRYTVYFIRLLEAFEERYAAKKKDKKVMDFADMEHNAVRILGDDAAAETFRRRFKYVFVDEYQDTNNIQEYLIGKVSRPDNVFKVGDIKQSIYKFRQAEPELFEKVYREYADPDNENGIAIDLAMNFRCNDATVRYINRVFERIMAGYDENAKLHTGCKCRAEYDFIPDVHILTESEYFDEEDEEGASDYADGVDGPADDGDDAGDIIEDLSKEEAEAAYIADLAYSLIGQEFHDTKADVVRKAEARDIVILLRSVKYRGDIMARALRKRGIESHVEESDDYFNTVEIGIALSLLTCIDNMKRDVPLIASLHSAAFGWTPEELALVRIAHREHLRSQKTDTGSSYVRPAYWEALDWYRTEGPEGELRSKAERAVTTFMEWRRLSRMMPLEDFVWKVLTDSGCYRMAGAMNGGSRRQANLRALADRAGKYSRETISSLSSFITFLDVMKQKKISNGQASMAGSDDDVVKILTIHKSKGLEYPFVIVGGLGHAFKTDKNEKKFSFDSTVGVSVSYVDPQRRFWRSTLMQRAINAKSVRDSFREELRVLYVAMTRARNKLILVGTCKSVEELMDFSINPTNFLKVLKDVIMTPDNKYYIRPLIRQESASRDFKGSWLAETDGPLSAEEEMLYDEIDRRFNAEYPERDLLAAKAKYSVSALRREELKAREAAAQTAEEAENTVSSSDSEPVMLWQALQTKKKASAADIGIAYHRVMEFLDFTKALPDGSENAGGSVDEAYIEERIRFLEDNNAIDEKVLKELDPGKIAEFFRSDLGRRTVRAARRGTLRREKPFTLKTTRGGRELLVQGVIDCCFEEDGKMVLIDYKSSFIRPDRPLKEELARIRDEYDVQIELYSEALAKGTGKEVGEAYLYLFAAGEAIRMA